MNVSKVKTLILLVLVSIVGSAYGQKTTEQSLKQLDDLLAKEDFKQTKLISEKRIDSLIGLSQYYELTDYIYYLGQAEFRSNGKVSAIQLISDFESKLESLTNNGKALRQLALETGSFYESISDSESAKNYNIKALEITKQMPDATGQDFAIVESNLAVFYSRLGDIPKAIIFQKKAVASLDRYPKSDQERYYISYNSLGGLMWYASKFDSAVFYYNKAEKILNKLERTPMNKYYRTAILNNNIAGINNIQGNIEGSMDAMQTTITNLTAFLNEDISALRRTQGREFLYMAIENYAGIYKDIGDFRKAKQLILYANEQKLKYLNADSPEIFKSKILLGQADVALKNFKEADQLLDEGIEGFKANPGGYEYWLADAHYYKATLNAEMGNLASAKKHFLESETYYKASLGNYYDELYLDFTVNASNFFAQIDEKEKALSMATEALDYIKANQGEKTLLEYYQEINLADIYYQTEDYISALNHCNVAIAIINSNEFSKNSQLNTLQVETENISAILLKVKTQLKLNPNRGEAFLIDQLSEINTAINLLEKKRAIVSSDNAAAILIQDNSGVFRIAKELNLELYQLTKKEKYIEDLLGYHESMIYHKIRNRLNSKSVELTANMPSEVLEKEKKLKEQLNSFLTEESGFDNFLENEKKWNLFLEELKSNYPNYYKLRYASISQSLQNIKAKIPEASTLIRYLFLNDKLYAFVISNSAIKMIEIELTDLNTKIIDLNTNTEMLEASFELQSSLYKTLWKPLEESITTKRVIIVPDKELFNLSFDLLTHKICKDYSDLKENSLLAKYNLSYNYSLFLIDKTSQPVGYNSNFVAFAPEFSDDMKAKYKIAIKDSVNIDYTYLNLLPQPFAKDLAENYSRLFNGNSFLNENASKQIFTEQAREHKIIHIGTHAESDNVSPEFSRLIFAKKTEEENNSLYTYEIYNQNLSSNLAILTACETGKPTFQPGEGMISLAHAFNYAGSESILTSLWKIDEQSSANIIENFYSHLKMGLPKDEALQKAKLDYLSTAKGRTLSPQYWAGLVLIGDASPIDLSPSNLWWIWALLVLVLLLGVFFFVKNKITARSKLKKINKKV